MFEIKPKPVSNEPTDTVSARIPVSSKRALEIAAQQWGVNVSDIIYELVEGRELYYGIASFNGILLEISEENKVHLESFCVKNNLNPTEYLTDFVNTHIQGLMASNLYTHTSFSESSVNSGQSIGLQAFASVNSAVNNAVNGRLQMQTEKMAFFANREKSLIEAVNSLKMELRFLKLFDNAINLITHAFENSGMMKKQLQKSTMYGILLDDFSEDEVQVLLGK